MFKKILGIMILFFCCIMDTKALTELPVDITTLSLTEIQNLLNNKVITSESLVNAYLERIEAYNDKYNAILYINSNALDEAKELDIKRNKNAIVGPLHGIPIVVKTNIDVKGLATTAGASALKDNYPNSDAEVIKKLKEAGAIILGTTNMNRFAFEATNSNSSFGKVRNAYNKDYSPYGSSGGSAVSVALSFASAALGTDTNSSVRVPASVNNLVGVRPTFGLVSSDGVIPYDITRDTIGVIAKTVKDSSILLEVIDNVETNYQTPIFSLKGKKIGVVNSFLKGSNTSSLKANSLTDDLIYESMQKAIKNMDEDGAEIVYLDDFFTTYYYSLWYNSQAGFTLCDGFNDYIKNTTGTIRNFSSLAKIYGLDGYLKSCNYLDKEIDEVNFNKEKLQKHVSDVFNENSLDVIIYPTTKHTALKMTELDNGIKAPSSFISSGTGFPSMTLPLDFDTNNMPYGIEFLAIEEKKLYEITTFYDITYNQITVPKDAPSLYQISNNVNNLVDVYLNGDLFNESTQKTSDLKAKIVSYFATYSSNQTKDDEAKVLLEEYNKLSNEYSSKLMKIGYIVLACSFLFILFKESKRNRK